MKMTSRHEQLLDKAERNLRALDRDLSVANGEDSQLLEDRQRTAEALQDLRDRRFSGAVVALIDAPVGR